MKSFIRLVLVLSAMMVSSSVFASHYYSYLQGNAKLYDNTGALTASAPLSGYAYNLGSPYYYQSLRTNSYYLNGDYTYSYQTILNPGTHQRYVGGVLKTIVVGPNQIGAVVSIRKGWYYRYSYGVMVWDLISDYTGVSLKPVDTDGDGIPGTKIDNGTLAGSTLAYTLGSGAYLPPSISISYFYAQGGSYQECRSHTGNDVTMRMSYSIRGNASTNPDAALKSIDWYLDGTLVSTGTSSTSDITVSLGNHNIKVVASLAGGASDSRTQYVNIVDRTSPTVEVTFTDTRSALEVDAIDESRMYFVNPVIVATDICDPAPQTNASAAPVHEIFSDTVLSIQGNLGKITMPATGVEVKVVASDASGNNSSTIKTLPIIQ